jgi:hypothetical protein
MGIREIGIALIALFAFEFIATATGRLADKIEKSLRLCIAKKIVDILFLFVFYFGYIFLVTYQRNPVEYLSFSFLSIGILIGFLILISKRYEKQQQIKSRILYGLCVLYDFLGVIIAFSLIYYFMYSFNNTWFTIESMTYIPRLAFEFIYFSFAVTITYAGSEISIAGVLPKIIQMLHIMIFYFYFANVVIESFNKRKK